MWDYLLSRSPLHYMTQSLWRDEAFSVLAADKPIGFIVSRLGFEPPVYYSMLHVWIRVFGGNDISARIFSLIGFLLATWIVIEWAAQLYKKHWLSVFLPLFFFLNPMLLYYAFEVRTYAWYTFFSIATLYTYSNKQWKLFVVSAILGFYTHVYLLPFLFALGVHWTITEKPWKRPLSQTVKKDPAFRSLALVGLAALPWLIRIAILIPQFSHSWYFPVDIRLVFSALGNMFTGYEGTPWYGWTYTKFLSLIIAGGFVLSWTDKKNRNRNLMFLLFGMLPLALVIGISFFKPLYVNRYLIPATIAEVFLLTAALSAIRKETYKRLAAFLMLVFVLWTNWWMPQWHRKAPFRETLRQIQPLLQETDIIVADNALIYLETLFYATDRSRVYLHNPDNHLFPWYIGDALFSPDRQISMFPVYPARAFLVHRDATFDIVYRVPAGQTSE